MHKLLVPLALGLATAGTASAQEFCEHPKSCSAQQYGIIKNDRCEKACIPNTAPPGEVMVNCDHSWGGFNCEVWPRGEELSYSYSATAWLRVSWAGPTDAPSVWVGCLMSDKSGTLTVQVTSPYGYSSQQSVSLSCRPQQEQ